jgi:hypothetical protein
MELPIYDNKKKTGDDGFLIVKRIVENKLNWRLRKNHEEDDFGIDAFMDIVTSTHNMSGKFINLQIKSGESYFKEKNQVGWVYRGEMRHLNYYLNHDSPVIILLVDINAEIVYWCLCDGKKTERAGENWKITIPFNNTLTASCKLKFEKYVSPITDYASQLDNYWKTNDLLNDHERILINIRKNIVLNNRFEQLIEAFERFESNEFILINSMNKVDICIDDFNSDPRELFQIKEVKKWVNYFTDNFKGWSYYLAKDNGAAFMKLMLLCKAKHTKVSKGNILTTPEDAESFFEIAILDLNKFCNKNSISNDLKTQLSTTIRDYLFSRK